MGPKQIGWSQESNLLWEVSKQLEYLKGILAAAGLADDITLTTIGTTGPSTLINGVLNVPVYGTGGGAPGLVTASNGLTQTPVGNVALGGALTGVTTINVGAFLLALTGNSPTSILRVTNSNTSIGSHGIQGVSGGANSYGVSGVNTGSGVGVYAQSNTGAAIRASSEFGQIILEGTITPTDVTGIAPMIRLFRDMQGAPVAGVGLSYDSYIKVDSGSTIIASRIITKLTNVVTATRTSEVSIQGILNGNLRDLIVLSGSGLVRLPQYGVSQPPGATAAVFSLQIDNQGRIIQAPLPVTNLDYLGTPTSGTITSSSGTGTPIPIANSGLAGLMSGPMFNKLEGAESQLNKQNSMVVDGTGTKYPTVDATNIFGNNILKVTANTGFIDRLDSFNMVLTDANTITITGSNPGAFVRTLLFAPPPIPAQAVVNISSRTLLASSITLPGAGRYYRFLGYDYATDSIVNSSTSFVLVDNIVQLAYVEMFQSAGGANTFTVLQLEPDLSTTSLYEQVMIANQTTVKILPNADLTVKNTAGTIKAHNISKGNANPHVKDFPVSAASIHINLDPSYLTTSTGFVPTSAVNVTNYWNGTALVPVPTPNNATIQRWLLTLGGRLYLQAGDFVYATKAAADAAISSVQFPDIIPGEIAIEICKMVAVKSATSLSDTTKVSFYYTAGGAGGASTPTPIFTVDNPGLVPAPGTVEGRFLADDGQWLIPSATGAQVYMFSTLNSDIGPNKKLVRLEQFTPGTQANVSVALTGTGGPGVLLGVFLTDPGFPGLNKINIGTGFCNFVVQKTGGAASNAYHCYFTISKRMGVSPFTETLLLTSANTSITTATTAIQHIAFVSNTSFIPLVDTDRILIRVYGVQDVGSSTVVEFRYDGTTNARFQSPYANSDVYELAANKQNSLDVDGTGDKFPTVDAVNSALVTMRGTSLFSLTDYNLPPTPGLRKSFNTFIDSVNLDVGVYKFSWLFGARNLSVVQSALSIGFLGTAATTPNNVKFSCNAIKANDVGNPASSTQSFQKGLLSSEYEITAHNNRASVAFAIEGIIRIFVPGTLIPAISGAGLNTGTALIEDRQLFQITKLEI